MLWTFLAAARGFLAKVPWQVWLVLAVLATGWLWGNHRYAQGRDDCRADYAQKAAEAVAQARKADDAARVTADAHKASVDAQIDAGRKAAEGSSDPWGSAIEGMK